MVETKLVTFFLDSDDEDEDTFFTNHCLEINFLNCSEIEITNLCFQRNKRNCIRNFVKDIVPSYSDKEFIMHFRVNRKIFTLLKYHFESSDCWKSLQTNSKIKSADVHILAFLWFSGHEAASFRDVADRFDLSIATLHRILKRVTYVISNLASLYIVKPNEEKCENTSRYFREKGLPGVIGCIDGTHIIIDPPRNGKDEYIDRKGNISLHVQGICNEQRKFIDIFIGYPGLVHDNRVFKNSPIYNELPDLCKDKFFLLGDSAYACSQFLITPYKDNGHLSYAQKKFNVVLSSCRVLIEHTFGILKQRFRQLYYCKLQGIKYLSHFIRALCVIHNIADMGDIELFENNAPGPDTAKQNNIKHPYNTLFHRGGMDDSKSGKSKRDMLCYALAEKMKN